MRNYQFQPIGLEYSNIVQNVYKEEVSNCETKESQKLMIISVHAVFLESGFVCFDSVAKKKIGGFHLPLGWNSKSTVSVQYILPNVLSEIVGLKFQSMGKYVYVHGFLSNNNPVCFFRFDTSRYVPSINYICMPSAETDKKPKSFHERELFVLWRTAKDGLLLPLLTDHSHKTGLDPPPCFTSLPADLKLRILEFLRGIDIGRVRCVSLELKYLSSNNDLWKKKYLEEYSQSEYKETGKDDWKDNYITMSKRLKKEKIFGTLHRWDRPRFQGIRAENFNGANIYVHPGPLAFFAAVYKMHSLLAPLGLLIKTEYQRRI